MNHFILIIQFDVTCFDLLGNHNIKHAKICTECHRKGECLKGVDMDCKKDDWKPCKSEKPCDPCKPREEKED